MRSLTLAIGLCALVSFPASLMAAGCADGCTSGCSTGMDDYTLEPGCGFIEPSCGCGQSAPSCRNAYWSNLFAPLPSCEPNCGAPPPDPGCGCESSGCDGGCSTGSLAPVVDAAALPGRSGGLAPVVNRTACGPGLLRAFLASRELSCGPGAGYVPGVSTCGVDGTCRLARGRRLACGCGENASCGLANRFGLGNGCVGCADGCGVHHCGMPAPTYPVPIETPGYVGYTQFAYPPMMPHHSLPHYRQTYAFRHAPGMARTTVNWRTTELRNLLKRVHHVLELPR